MISGFWEASWEEILTSWVRCLQSVCFALLTTFFCLPLVCGNTRPVHAVSSRLWQREGPGQEQEVHIWHSSRTLQRNRGGHDPEPHPWERYAGPGGVIVSMYVEKEDVLIYVFSFHFYVCFRDIKKDVNVTEEEWVDVCLNMCVKSKRKPIQDSHLNIVIHLSRFKCAD